MNEDFALAHWSHCNDLPQVYVFSHLGRLILTCLQKSLTQNIKRLEKWDPRGLFLTPVVDGVCRAALIVNATSLS